MTSYAFEENNIIDKAKLLALNSLKQSSNDLWSWHALLHVHDNENNDSINNNDNFNKINSFEYKNSVEGWGICNDGNKLYNLDGGIMAWNNARPADVE